MKNTYTVMLDKRVREMAKELQSEKLGNPNFSQLVANLIIKEYESKILKLNQ